MGLKRTTQCWLVWMSLLCLITVSVQGAPAKPASNVEVLQIKGTVECLRGGAEVWDRIQIVNSTNQFFLFPGDQLRTQAKSSAVVRMTDKTLQKVGENSYLRLAPKEREGSFFRFFNGIYYFFHRDNPGRVEMETPTVSAVVRGTEFVLKIADNGTTTISLVDGEVFMSNEHGELTLKSGEEGRAAPGEPPTKTARIVTVKNIQWCLYYPAVLDLNELQLTREQRRPISASLEAYQAGNLPTALELYPADREPTVAGEQLYLAGLLLSVGNVEEALVRLKTIIPTDEERNISRLSAAIQQFISLVQLLPVSETQPPTLATEHLVTSYQHQSNSRLTEALNSARRATRLQPDFSFAWARVAELEFSFGHRWKAVQAVQRALELAPQNAQALTLKGFILASDNRTDDALDVFNEAIAIDGDLGNAWLGRGLCRIRAGEIEPGRLDLQMAATLEPQRAFLRSYLGKGYSESGDSKRAQHELDLARKLDPMDPTPWLYSALLNQQDNEINRAIGDLETSQDLNDNRSLYRSRFLLDQDQAVRGANLARLYQEAGMTDVARRKASEAISLDYANYSSHFFLANSYNVLRGNGREDLRFETAAVNEYLVGNLLAPPGAGTLSPQVNQQEFSRLFEQDRFGFVSSTEYLSRGDWTQTGAQYGIFGNSSYAIEGTYRSATGERANNDFEQIGLSARFKQQLTPQDSLYLQAIYSDTESGDLSRNYGHVADDVRIKESQEPIALIGLNHEWHPGSHTLLLAGRLQDTLRVNDPTNPLLIFLRDGNDIIGGPLGLISPNAPNATPGLQYRSETEIYTAEAQQIWQTERHSVIAGARFQIGTFDTKSDLTVNSSATSFAVSNAPLGGFQANGLSVSTNLTHDFERISLYGYYTWNIIDPLTLISGVSYDRLFYPDNFRSSPIADGQQTRDQVSPKFGVVWTPFTNTTLRAAYTRSLGGVSFDQSFRLEPSQVAGFNQAYRSLLPESAAGQLDGARFETFNIALDQRIRQRTFLGLELEMLRSRGTRMLGTEELTINFPPTWSTATTPEQLEYEERSLNLSVNHLLGRHVAVGARYRFSQAELERRLSGISTEAINPINSNVEALLHQARLFAHFNHGTGIFSNLEAIWSQQSNRGYSPDLPGDDFWHFNAYVGYRFQRRFAEIQVGILNITDQDYQLNSLNLTPELPRERNIVARLKLSF